MKSNRYLSDVNTPWTIDWIIASKIIPYLQDSEQITLLELLSRQWKALVLKHWLKKRLPEVKEELVTNKPWSWRPPKLIPWKSVLQGNWQPLESIHSMQLMVESLDLVVKKIKYFVEAYIQQHAELSDSQRIHLRSRHVTRELIEGKLALRDAVLRVVSAVFIKCENDPMPGETQGLNLGIPPTMFRNNEGIIINIFGPYHVNLVVKHDVPPELIHKRTVAEIKKLPILSSLFPAETKKSAKPVLSKAPSPRPWYKYFTE